MLQARKSLEQRNGDGLDTQTEKRQYQYISQKERLSGIIRETEERADHVGHEG